MSFHLILVLFNRQKVGTPSALTSQLAKRGLLLPFSEPIFFIMKDCIAHEFGVVTGHPTCWMLGGIILLLVVPLCLICLISGMEIAWLTLVQVLGRLNPFRLTHDEVPQPLSVCYLC